MITNKINLLNKTVIESLSKKNEAYIFKVFTDLGIKIFKADFGFVWLNPELKSDWELVYKTKNLPFRPKAPRKGGRNYNVLKSRKIDFITNLKKVADARYVSRYMKSFVIIPIFSHEKTYGTMVLCFKKKESFSQEKKGLSALFGNSIAHAITIKRLMEYKQETSVLREKQKATDILLAQEKSKTEFITNITHELRTPLAIMRGNIYLAQKNAILRPVKSALRAIDEEVINLSDMLSDLVLIASGRNVALKLAPVDIVEFIQGTIERIKTMAAEKGIRIDLKCKKKNVFILGDTEHLEKLFLNLLTNTITYGRSKIDVAIETKADRVIVKIKDNGIGIGKEDLPKIFERFYQADKSHSGKHSGLGLAIAKKMAEMHKGKINVKSSLGEGSIFTVTLPRKITRKKLGQVEKFREFGAVKTYS